MRNTWYADDRDLIKWGGIIHLCNTTGINHVMQVAYFRNSSWGLLEFDGKDVPIPEDVITHFRDIGDIKRLAKMAGITIDIVTEEFVHSEREAYTNSVCQRIQNLSQRQIVFLDPDNGLAPQKATDEHVKSEEIAKIWKCLRSGDYIVLYQHSPHIVDWKNIRKTEFAIACKIATSEVKIWEAKEKVKDVVFFFSEK